MSGFWCQVPDNPAKAKTKYINNCQHISNAILGSHCKANIVVRSDSIAIQFLVSFLRQPRRIQSVCFYFVCRNYVSPIMFLIWWSCGVPPPSPKRLFCNDFRIITIYMAIHIINIHTGNCKFLSYNGSVYKWK